jgi:dimethylglycine dehydrogenase
VGRVSYTGDLGYEIWMKPQYQRYLYDLILDAGKEFGIRLFGLRALNALRLEKSYGSWSREYRPLYSPLEARLDRFVALDKATDFIGKAAARSERESGGTLRLCTFILEAKDADVIGDEPISLDGVVRGWVTSGGYAHAAGVSVAVGYVPKDVADVTEGWSVELLGEMLPARLQRMPLFDPSGAKMRK